MKYVVAFLFFGWVVGLVAIEWVALCFGVSGCVVGSIALVHAIRALIRLNYIEEANALLVSDLAKQAETLDDRLTSH